MSEIQKGFSLIEIVVASAVLLLSFVSVITAFQLGARRGTGTLQEIQAASLAEEGGEALASIRDVGWGAISSLAVGEPYGLYFDGTRWRATTTAEVIDGVFRRTFTLAEVYRRTSDQDIVASTSLEAKVLDPNTKHLTVRVSWEAATTSSAGARRLEGYLFNLFE
jgi:prepilin-type N-terminal cleavage/methylation domain-containing protein